MNERRLRAKIRDLMASGNLPRVRYDGCLITEAGRAESGQCHVGTVNSISCLVCGEPAPQVSYQYPGGIMLHLHAACDVLWQQERRP